MPCRRIITPPDIEARETPDIVILVDADACPVKAEVYRVAARHGLKTYVVANSFIAVPRDAGHRTRRGRIRARRRR